MKKLDKEEIKRTKELLEKLGEASEGFLFIVYKTKKDRYKIVQYAYKIPVTVLEHYINREILDYTTMQYKRKNENHNIRED